MRSTKKLSDDLKKVPERSFMEGPSLSNVKTTIDLAYAMFSLEFKLPSKKIEKRRRKKFLGLITYGSHTAVRFEERNLSEKEKEHFRFLPHEVSQGI